MIIQQVDILSLKETSSLFLVKQFHYISKTIMWHPFDYYFGLQLSYQIVDSFVWLGIRDMINDLRKRKLKLRPVTYISGTHAYSNDIPHAYIWSPYLVPKPKGRYLMPCNTPIKVNKILKMPWYLFFYFIKIIVHKLVIQFWKSKQSMVTIYLYLMCFLKYLNTSVNFGN